MYRVTSDAADAADWHWCMHGVWPTDADYNYVLLPNGSTGFDDVTAVRPLVHTAVAQQVYFLLS
jgi:hypothetical protein